MKLRVFEGGSVVLLACLGVCGWIVFHYFGNAVRGWIDTPSMFYWWISQWLNPDCEAQHGPLIAFVSIWLFVRGLKNSPHEQQQSRVWTGAAIVILGLVLHGFGYVVQHTRLSIVAFLVYLIGAAYMIGGKRAGRASLFPCLLMLFTIPLQVLFDLFSYPIRLAVIDAAHFLSQGMGFDVLREGTTLYSTDDQYVYDVAPACSGLRSLMAMMSLVLIVGHLIYKQVWPQVLLFLGTFLFAYCGNVVRLFSIIVAAEWLGQPAGKLVHDSGGFVVFIIVLGLALASVSLSTRLFPDLQLQPRDWKLPVLQPSLNDHKAVRFASLSILCVSIATAWGIWQVDRLSISNACGIELQADGVQPVMLPEVLNFDWMGQRVAVTQLELDSLPEDTGFSRVIYENLRGEHVFISIVLSGKDRTSIHRPEICLDAQGWEIMSSRRHWLNVPSIDEGALEVTLLEVQRMNRDGEIVRALFTYWFVGDGVVVSNHWDRVVAGFRDRVFDFKRTRWAYVFAQTRLSGGEEASLKRIEEVIEWVLPQFQNPTNEVKAIALE